jgi:hypothetical protein
MSKDNTASSNVIPFAFEAKGVRVQEIDGAPWFCATDVCSILGYRNAPDAITKHCREAGIAKRDIRSVGQQRSLTFIDEGNLYRLIIKSRKEEAQRFEAWVCDEVLPAIRKHGRYSDSLGRMGTLIGQTIGTDGFHMLGSIVKGKVSGLPMAVRRRATSKIWAQTHAAFGVRSAEDIPADQLDSVRNFIAAYVLEGELIGRDEKSISTVDIPQGHSLVQRWLVSRGSDGKPRIKEIPIDACVMSAPEFLDQLNAPNGLCATQAELFDFAIKTMQHLRRRIVA